MAAYLSILQSAVLACVNWTNQLFVALDATWLIVATFALVVVVSLFLVPLRGPNDFGDPFSDFTFTKISRKSSTDLVLSSNEVNPGSPKSKKLPYPTGISATKSLSKRG